MKYLITIPALFILISCTSTPKKESQWYAPNGQLATEQEILALKQSCSYDQKSEEVSALLKQSISSGRYSQSGNNSTDPNSDKAMDIMEELHACMRKTGYYTQKKS